MTIKIIGLIIGVLVLAAGARVSVRIQWSEYDVTYAAPTV